MPDIAVTETIIGIHAAVKAANHAAEEMGKWLDDNRASLTRRSTSLVREQTRYIQNIIRILPRINPAKQTPESCRSLVMDYQNLAAQFDETKRNPATLEPVRLLVQAAGTDTLVIIQGLPGLAQRELAANNPYADALADALWHTIAIAAVAGEQAAKN